MSNKNKTDMIIWPIDPFQETDNSTLKVAAVIRALTKKWNAKILPVYILTPKQFNINPVLWTDWEIEHRALAEKKLKSLLKRSKVKNLLSPKILVEPALTTRALISRLLNFADDQSANLIVAATHGRKGIKRLFMGSFAETLVLRSRIPLLTINPSFEATKAFDRILFPTDLRRKAKNPFLKVVEFSKKIGAELVIFNRFMMLSSPDEIAEPDSYAEYEQDELKRHRLLAERLAAEASTMGVKASVIVDLEQTMHEVAIVKQCAGRKSQIVAMVPERGGVEAFFFGSITRNVVRNAHCPVWVLHQ